MAARTVRPASARRRVRLALRVPGETALAGVCGKGGLAALSGWIHGASWTPCANAGRAFSWRYWLERHEPTSDEIAKCPRWCATGLAQALRAPGENYGVPRYGEFDPVLPFAITYLLLFGAMFGDVATGGDPVAGCQPLSALGRMAWWVSRRGRCRCCSACVRQRLRYEDILSPLWLSPLHDPIRVLTIAVGFGVGFIVFTLLVNARNKFVADTLPRRCSIPPAWRVWCFIWARSAAW